MRLGRRTVPPRVLPLLPVCVVALAAGGAALGLFGAVLSLVGGHIPVLAFLAYLAVGVPYFVVLSLALRWLVRRWVARHPPLVP